MPTENLATNSGNQETPRQRAEREAQELVSTHRSALADGSANEAEQWQIYGAYREYAEALQAGNFAATEIQEIAKTYGLNDAMRGSIGALVPPQEFNVGHFTPPEIPYEVLPAPTEKSAQR
jgi:hypothetical protein